MLILYLPCKNSEEAKKICTALLKDKLIACGNLHATRSFYWWNNKIEEEDEVILFAKTRKELQGKVEKKVRALHSYSVPCILWLPIHAINPDYKKWVEGVTK